VKSLVSSYPPALFSSPHQTPNPNPACPPTSRNSLLPPRPTHPPKMPRAGKYTLHNKHGFLSAHGDRVDARADAHEHNEWSLEKHGDYWLVSAYNSHKLASDAHGTVRLHAESHADSHFQIGALMFS